MSSDENMEIRLTHLEDQMNRMNIVLADQGRKVDELITALSSINRRFKLIEEGFGDEIASESPPDGVNR